MKKVKKGFYTSVPTNVQNTNFEHLLKLAINQKLVRNCVIEGMVCNLEKDIETVADLGLITFGQYESIMKAFK